MHTHISVSTLVLVLVSPPFSSPYRVQGIVKHSPSHTHTYTHSERHYQPQLVLFLVSPPTPNTPPPPTNTTHLAQGIVELCVARYRDSESPYVGMRDAALCTLRCQLLMALHDAGETDLCQKEPCHKLAWTLDACLKVGPGCVCDLGMRLGDWVGKKGALP